MKSSNTMIGLLIIVVGVILLLGNLNIIFLDFELLWPIFLLIPGLVFELSYFITGRNPGLLVPGGILITYSLLFFTTTVFGGHLFTYLWPVFPLGVAIGLFQLYLFGKKDNGLLIAVIIIAGFSIVALSFTLIKLSFIMPILLIVLGVFILLKR